jgi:uncharacterized protein YlxP (DUF503 family)
MGKGTSELRVCAARIELSIPGAFTLKDRRAVVKSLVERLKGKFNLSVSDLDGGENGAAKAALGIAAATNSASLASETVQKAIEFIASDGRAELGQVDIDEL